MPTLKGKDIIAIMKKAHLAKFQKKTVTPNTVGQTIKPDSGYDGLSEVVIGSSTLTAKKTVTPKTTSQTINPDSGDIGLLGVVVNATPLTSQKTVTPQIYSQTLYPNSGHLGIKSVVVNATPLTSQKTVTPGTSNQNIVPDSGDLGLTGVVVEGDANLIAENIKENVSIFGVVGSLKGAGPNKLNQYFKRTLTELTEDDLAGLKFIDYDQFNSLQSLESVVIPDGVTSIRDNAFLNCQKLSSVTISNTVKTIEYQVFQNCYKLTSIVIPDSVTSIGGGCFQRCLELSNVTMGNGVTTIKHDTFDGCSKLTSIIIPDSVTTIEHGAFSDTGLKSIVIPDSVTSLGYATFYGCRNLINAVLGNGITVLEHGLFSVCSNLTSITIPENVATIEKNALNDMGSSNPTSSSIVTITMLPATPPSIVTDPYGQNESLPSISKIKKIIVPLGCGDAYKAASGWSNYSSKIVEATE